MAVHAGAVQDRSGGAPPPRVVAVQRWIAAVETHVPGLSDDALLWAQTASARERGDLNAGVSIFLSTLTGRGATASTPDARRLVELGRDKAMAPGPKAFLRRAAMLHSDAALAGVIAGAPPGVDPSGDPSGFPRARDGEYAGMVGADWNWPFARRLLEFWPPSPASDPFVVEWYHATTSALLWLGHYGEANPQLERASAVLPDVAIIAMDRGVYFEGLTLPRARLALEDPRTKQVLRGRGAPLGPGERTIVVTPPASRAPEHLKQEAEAERQFRRALALDPALVEARVRLARIQSNQGRPAEALRELTHALAAGPDRVTAFYAHLFAGRAARALGQLETAAGHTRAARVLFPRAQSALVADSHLALVRGDRAGAISPTRDLAGLDPDARDDPWWQYAMGPGRNARALLEALWERKPGEKR